MEGKPVQIIKTIAGREKHTFELDLKALQDVLLKNEAAKERPIVLISVRRLFKVILGGFCKND